MIAFILPILNAVFGGVITPFVNAWVNYKKSTLVVEEKGFEAGAVADATVMAAALSADVQLNALKIQVYGQPINRLIMFIAGVPPAVHFGMVFVDTILASKLFLARLISACRNCRALMTPLNGRSSPASSSCTPSRSAPAM